MPFWIILGSVLTLDPALDSDRPQRSGPEEDTKEEVTPVEW